MIKLVRDWQPLPEQLPLPENENQLLVIAGLNMTDRPVPPRTFGTDLNAAGELIWREMFTKDIYQHKLRNGNYKYCIHQIDPTQAYEPTRS